MQNVIWILKNLLDNLIDDISFYLDKTNIRMLYTRKNYDNGVAIVVSRVDFYYGTFYIVMGLFYKQMTIKQHDTGFKTSITRYKFDFFINNLSLLSFIIVYFKCFPSN